MDITKLHSFTASGKKDWINAASNELKGKDPFEQLTKIYKQLEIKPYYDADDLHGISIDQLPDAQNPFLGPRTWKNVPMVEVKSEEQANKKALQYLTSGADGILFVLDHRADIAVLLDQIQLPFCSVCFKTGQADLANDFRNYIDSSDVPPSEVTGFMITPSTSTSKIPKPLENFSFVTHDINNPDVISAITIALVSTVKQLDQLNDGEDPGIVFSSMAFSFSIGVNFFEEHCKLKAFRYVWQRFQTLYGLKKFIAAKIHAYSPVWAEEKYEPNANMIKGTMAAISAVLGGADYITVQAEDDREFKTRIAMNISSILREESHLAAVSDATAGSYFLDSLTQQIADKSWNSFVRTIENEKA